MMTRDLTGARGPSTVGGMFSDVGTFDFDPANGAPYSVYAPDVLAPQTDAVTALDYVGGTGGAAGVRNEHRIYRTVTFGFPFETISSAVTWSDVMQRIITFLQGVPGPEK